MQKMAVDDMNPQSKPTASRAALSSSYNTTPLWPCIPLMLDLPRSNRVSQPSLSHLHHYHHDLNDAQRDLPQSLLLPYSLRPSNPGRQVLFRHQRVLFAPQDQRTLISRVSSDMSLKVQRWRDRLRDYRKRLSPAVFRYAGVIFLFLVGVAFAAVVVGWWGLSADTIRHHSVTNATNATGGTAPVSATQGPAPPNDDEDDGTFVAMVDPSDFRAMENSHSVIRSGLKPMPAGDHKMDMQRPIEPKESLSSQTDEPSTQPDTDTGPTGTPEVTIFRTVTITTSVTGRTTELRTTTILEPVNPGPPVVATTLVHTTHPTSISSATASAGSTEVMTGLMYCSFTGRSHIYTLCPWVHMAQPKMLESSDIPIVGSAASSRMHNPLTSVRLAMVSLWKAVPSYGRAVMQYGDTMCECSETKSKLDHALELVRMQQQLLKSQQELINEHRKSYTIALDTLESTTGSRPNGSCIKSGYDDGPLDVKD
ncbi:hypothetical protein F5Y15DRAFT_179678 [Xylariaceae sp. FL0016]|nr:hypothetical protein F5Y15DRAFT_179678 [Xylariaceae sp. FL0016]